MADPTDPDFDAISQAARRIAHVVHRTPVLRSRVFRSHDGRARILQVREFSESRRLQIPRCHQRRAFAYRRRSPPRRGHALVGQSCPGAGPGRPDARHSGDNRHAVQRAGRKAVPRSRATAPRSSACEPSVRSREETAEAVVRRTGAVFVHPYNDATDHCRTRNGRARVARQTCPTSTSFLRQSAVADC